MALNGNGAGRTGRLKSWKEIAAFFGADERTVKRWEVKRGLPVRRIPGGAKGTVYAEVAELEHWLNGEAGPPAPSPPARPRRTPILAGAALLLVLVVGGGVAWRGGGDAALPPHHQPSQAVADLYFAGRYNFERRVPESLNRAVALFSQAIRSDPQYAEAYAGLANCHLLLREYAGVPDAVAYPRARAAAQRALALDANLAEAHAALAFVTFFFDHDFEAGLRGFRRAIALAPDSSGAHHWYASALYHAGRVDEALMQIDEAQRLEPQSQSILADKALILFSANRTAEAVALLHQLEAADPAYSSPHAYLARIDLARGDYPGWLGEARAAALLIHDPDQLSVVNAAEQGWRAGGAPAMFAALIERQRALYAAGRMHGFDLAASYSLAGQQDAALHVLALAVRDRDPYLVGLRVDSRFAALRRSPDFERLALSVGGG